MKRDQQLENTIVSEFGTPPPPSQATNKAITDPETGRLPAHKELKWGTYSKRCRWTAVCRMN